MSGVMPEVDPRSVLLVTLDSCRYDTFAAADVPNLRRIGRLHGASAPSTFTCGTSSTLLSGTRADDR